MPVVTLDTLDTLRQRENSWTQRNCPGIRNCWSFGWDAYDLRTNGDRPLLLRRLCMWTILALRTIFVAIGLVYVARHRPINPTDVVVTIFIGVIDVMFLGWCLARIGEAQGVRKVLEYHVNRTHLDIALGLLALGHIGVASSNWLWYGIDGLGTTWTVLWVLVVLEGWICTWWPETESYV